MLQLARDATQAARFEQIIAAHGYTAITVNPNQMAEDMKKNGGFIPGVKPGKKTAEFIDNVIRRVAKTTS